MASANDMFQKVGRATATTLSAPGYTTGDSSVNIGSTTNWPTDTGVTFAIDVVDAAGERIAGTYNVFRGRVAGASQVDQVVYEGGDAHRSYPSGATTRVYILVSSYRDNRTVDGISVSHNQDGTIKGPSVVTALTGQTLPANTVTTPAITDASVTPVKIDWSKFILFNESVTTGITVATPGYWVSFGPDMTFTSVTGQKVSILVHLPRVTVPGNPQIQVRVLDFTNTVEVVQSLAAPTNIGSGAYYPGGFTLMAEYEIPSTGVISFRVQQFASGSANPTYESRKLFKIMASS